MATAEQNLSRFQEIANRGLQDELDPDKRARFDEAIRRQLIKPGPGFATTAGTAEAKARLSAGPQLQAPGGPSVEFLPGGEETAREEILTTAGSIAGGLAGEAPGARIGAFMGAALTRSPAGARVGGTLGALAGSALGAGVGGAAGELGEIGLEGLQGDPRSPADFTAGAKRVLRQGGEEALFDFVANSFFRGGAAVGRKLFQFTPKEGAAQLQKALEGRGSTLSLDQAVDNTLIKSIGELLRGSSFSSGAFKNLDTTQEALALDLTNEFIERLSKTTRDQLKPAASGRLIKTVIREGEQLHSEAARTYFSMLDELASEITVLKPGTAPVGLKPFGGEVAAEIPEVLKAVDMRPIRQAARQELAEMAKIGKVDPKGEGASFLSGVASGEDRLSFSEAHRLISDMKRLQRAGNLKGLPAEVKLGQLIGDAEGAFNTAGNQLGGEATKFYKKIRNFWKFGKSRFNNDFIADLVSKDPTKIGEQLAGESPENLLRIKSAVRASGKMTGKDFNENWSKVVGGFMEELLPTNMENLLASPIAKLKTDRSLQRSVNVMLNSEQRNALKKSVSLLEDVLLNQGRRGNLTPRELAASATAGAAIFGTAGATATASTALGGLPAGVAAFLITPNLMARGMTNPKFVRLLTDFDKAPVASKKFAVALTKLSTLMEEITEVVSTEEEKQR